MITDIGKSETRTCDRIFLHGLRVETRIGIFEWEQSIDQPLIIDLDMATDIRLAAHSDDVADTIDYKAVSKRVQQFVRAGGFRLIEGVGEGIATILIEEFGIPWVRVRVNKPGAVRGATDVGLVIERAAEDSTGL